MWHVVTPASMSIVGLILAIEAQVAIVVVSLPKFQPLVVTQLSNALTIDAAGIAFGIVACAGTLVAVLMSMDHLQGETRNHGEFYMLLMYACCAATLCALAADFLSIYLSIEFLSISSYVLAGFAKTRSQSVEAAVKYYLFGAACSAAMLYGMSLLYGLTGTLNLAELSERLAIGQMTAPLVWVAVVLVLAGLGFKIAAVPFHLWAPDVYEGAPTPVTAFLSIVSKTAGLAVLLRLLWTSLSATLDWVSLIAVISAVSMTLGNLAAIPQKSIKRMLAYSSIAQAGYLLLGFAALGARLDDPSAFAVQGILIYLLGYLLANLGAFAAVVAVERATGTDEIEAWRGLMGRSPLLAIAMVVFLLSLAGIPPTLGFAGKFWIFAAAIKTNIQLLWWLAAAGVANSVISVYYYFNVARLMFFDESADHTRLNIHPASRAAVWACAAASIVLLLLLQPVGRAAATAAWMSFIPH